MGGDAASERPDDPAVEGRVSALSTGEGGVLRGAGFLRVGTPSGQVHCDASRRQRRQGRDATQERNAPLVDHDCNERR